MWFMIYLGRRRIGLPNRGNAHLDLVRVQNRIPFLFGGEVMGAAADAVIPAGYLPGAIF